MSRANTVAQYTRLLAQWPADRIRPSPVHIQRLFQKRIDGGEAGSSRNDALQLKAVDFLLDNVSSKRYPLSAKILEPISDPQHYQKLVKEIEEAPDRSWFGRMAKKLQGMIRFR